MRIIYFGTASFAVPALEAIESSVVAVVSQPERPSGRHLALQPSPVAEVATRLGKPLLAPEKARDPAFVEQLRQFDADLFVVAAYGQILRKVVLDLPRLGCVNLHGSLLPAWRGAAPIQRSIEAGDKVSGVTLMQMDEGMDTGAILATVSTPIASNETAGELTHRLSRLAANLLTDNLSTIGARATNPVQQTESLATYAPKISRDDSVIQFHDEAETAYNRHRAVTPVPGCQIITSLGPIKVLSCRLGTESGLPGTVIRTKPELVVAFKSGCLELLQVQPQGKKRMSGRDFANGARIVPGSCLI